MKQRIVTLFLICTLLTVHSYGAGIELNGFGARATAMGGNYRAIATDWSAMYWNPAGLAFTSGWQVGINMSYVMPRASMQHGSSQYYAQTQDAAFQPFSAAYAQERDSEPINFILPAFGVSYSTEKWAFGVGIWVPMAWGSKWDVLDTDSVIHPLQTRPYNSQYPQYEYETNLQIIDVHPTVAYRINDKFSVGAGLSLLFGQVDIRQPVFLQNPYLYDPGLYKTVKEFCTPEQLAILVDMRKPPYDHLINQVELASTGNGIGANLGFMYKPTDEISIGVSAQFYSNLNISGDYKQTAYFSDVPEYNELVKVFDDTLISKFFKAGQLDSIEYKAATKFYSGEIEALKDTQADVSLALPLKVGIGMSYSGIANLLLAVDVSYTQWSVWDVIRINDTKGNYLSQLVQNWNDTFKYGIGAEYTTSKAIFRAGFSYENRAAVDEAVSPTIPDISDRYTLDLGIAIPIGPLDISLGYEHIFMADKEISEWVYDDSNKYKVTQNIAGLYRIKANSLMLGVDYHF